MLRLLLFVRVSSFSSHEDALRQGMDAVAGFARIVQHNFSTAPDTDQY
jgi:hypothetical protein